jgi:hypothetical protein
MAPSRLGVHGVSNCYPYPQIRGHVGAWDRTDKAWTDDSCALVTCNVSYPLYCIQN